MAIQGIQAALLLAVCWAPVGAVRAKLVPQGLQDDLQCSENETRPRCWVTDGLGPSASCICLLNACLPSIGSARSKRCFICDRGELLVQ